MSRLERSRNAFGHSLRDPDSRATKLAGALFGKGFYVRLPYPPTALNEPRYGYGRPEHRRLAALLERGLDGYEEVLRGFGRYEEDLRAIPLEKQDERDPHWRNPLLFGLDGVSLYCFARERAPRVYLEIGSGNSTRFVDRARRDGNIEMEMIAIDPHPRAEVASIVDEPLRQPLETVDLSLLDRVHSGDMVFLDGSHRVFMNSDVTVFFLDVLPELPPNVLVGIHDIHLPDDYLPRHAGAYLSEQYLLACYLLAESPWLQTVLPCWYVSKHPRTEGLARSLVPGEETSEDPGGERGSAHLRAQKHPEGVCFWLLTGERPQR